MLLRKTAPSYVSIGVEILYLPPEAVLLEVHIDRFVPSLTAGVQQGGRAYARVNFDDDGPLHEHISVDHVSDFRRK